MYINTYVHIKNKVTFWSLYSSNPRIACTCMHLDVDRLSSAGGSDEEARLLVLDEQVHEEGVADRVHRGDDDGVELGVLCNGRHILNGLHPGYPLGGGVVDIQYFMFTSEKLLMRWHSF